MASSQIIEIAAVFSSSYVCRLFVRLISFLALAYQVVNALDKYVQYQLNNAGASHKNYNQGNAVNAVLFELINYLIHLDPSSPNITIAGTILGSFLTSKETNYRYLALETMAHMAATGDPLQVLVQHEKVIVLHLQDKDISVRRRALDLLYSMCNAENHRSVVAELLAFLNGDSDNEFQADLVLKIAILAEKYVNEYTWYVDVVLKLITISGDYASESLWHRVVQIVTNHQDLREYAAYTVLQALKEPSCHEVTVSIAGYILGEFGHVIVESPGCTPLEQFVALHSKFGISSTATRAILLSTYFKFVNLFPEIQGEVVRVLEAYRFVLDVELQQRACEYLAIIKMGNETLLPVICEEMPPFKDRESTLLNQLTEKLYDTEDLRTWTIGGLEAQDEVLKKRQQKKVEKSSGSLDQNSREQSLPASQKSIPLVTSSQPALDDAQSPSPELIKKMYHKLLLQPSGVLYEDVKLQIGIKSEYQQNLGRIAVFFGNKTESPLSEFRAVIRSEDDVLVTVLEEISLIVPASTQLHKLVSVEAVTIPLHPPTLEIYFKHNGASQKISLLVPISVGKFIDPVSLGPNDFFTRWTQMGESKESQLTFTPVNSIIDLEMAKKVARGCGLDVIDQVDPNPDNIVLAGIFTSSTIGKVGCLARLESNREYKVNFCIDWFVLIPTFVDVSDQCEGDE